MFQKACLKEHTGQCRQRCFIVVHCTCGRRSGYVSFTLFLSEFQLMEIIGKGGLIPNGNQGPKRIMALGKNWVGAPGGLFPEVRTMGLPAVS